MNVLKKSINHIKSDIKTYRYNKKHFSKEIAKAVFKKSFFYYLLPKKREEYKKRQDTLIYEYLKNKYHNLILKYNKLEDKPVKCKKKYIWVFWYQGIKNAPLLVKKCVESINIHKGDYEVVFLDKENIKNYLEISPIIYEKLNKGIISYTHFSDILRMGLLSKHGGIWVDATCFITSDVFEKFSGKVFNSSYDEESKWCGFFIGGMPNRLFSFCYELLIEYNLKEDSLIEYFLIDHVISLAYKDVVGCKQLIDEVTIQNEHLSYFSSRFNQIYEKQNYQKMLLKAPFYKLSYKKKFKEYQEGKLTNYGYFIGKEKR